MNQLPGRDDLPPGTSLRDIDPDPRPWLDEEPEQLACRQCGRRWDEPKLSTDGVCPLCLQDLDER